MHVDWSSLLVVAVVAAAASLAVVLLVAFAVVGLTTGSGRRVAGPYDGASPGTRPDSGVAVAALCVLAAGLIVGYGLYLIIA